MEQEIRTWKQTRAYKAKGAGIQMMTLETSIAGEEAQSPSIVVPGAALVAPQRATENSAEVIRCHRLLVREHVDVRRLWLSSPR